MTTTTIPFQFSDDTLTFLLDGRPESVFRDSDKGRRVFDVLTDESLTDADRLEQIRAILIPVTTLAGEVDDSRITIEGRKVLFDGENLPSALSAKLLNVVEARLPLAPWAKFVVRLFDNPSRGAQAELNQFLEAANLPITADGCFLAYKRVSSEYRDLHTGRFDNSVGKVVSMPRQEVDPDRDRHCSRGLHFCSKEYLGHFYRGAGRIVIVKVDPADVVSIPSDYSFTKGRTWRYEVVGEVDLSVEGAKEEWGIYDDTFTVDDDWAGWDVADDDEADEYVDEADADGFVLFTELHEPVGDDAEIDPLVVIGENLPGSYIQDVDGNVVWEANVDPFVSPEPAPEPKESRLDRLRRKFGRL